ncbi:uncharacterized protein LOC111308245 [Durio zibethinus]|uniref:Uncharacterized protein LOC111308245 n=1 Tax=Durio zibethinus TaxID=66656 RepID=A0A6P6ABL9_DURZI|nr:uncharacterized protein LOC111308245 [Durio zibethinus]
MQEFAGMDDRFSALSQQLAFHILSFLNIEDLGQLMLVSRRCKSLCVSVPCLTVDNRNYTHNLISRQRFNQFVDKFFVLRSNSGTKTPHFTLVWSFQGSRCDQKKKRKKIGNSADTEESLVAKWLSKVSLRGVERLSISLVPQEGSPNYFPRFVLCSKSLKDLKFCSNNCVLKFTRSFSLRFPSGLESLTLQYARIPDKFFSDAISELYSLKSLYLYECVGLKGIYIQSASLKQLKIINEKPVELCHLDVIASELEKIFVTWYPADFSRTSFQITCSGLQDFVWYGYPVNFYHSEGNWSDLQCAALYLTLPPGSEVGSFSRHDVQYVLPRLERSAKFLRLHAKTIEILFKLGHLTTQLDAVRNLAIDYCFLSDDQVPIIASFLKTISCLETFYLTSSPTVVQSCFKDGKLKAAMSPEGFGFSVEYWETQELRFIDELKKATVEVHREEGNDMELVKYLLKHARGLEYLTIVCAPSLASSIPGRLSSYTKVSTKFNFCLRPQTDACN